MSDGLKTYNRVLQSSHSNGDTGPKHHMHDKHYKQWLKNKPREQTKVVSNKKHVGDLSINESAAISLEIELLRHDMGFPNKTIVQPSSRVKTSCWASAKKSNNI